jgi:hypothetical protein
MRYLIRHYVTVFRVFATEPALQALLLTALAVLGGGTVFYRYVEDWGWLDSLYFCSVTLTTIGYGDFAPRTDAGKLFTVFYVFLGLGIITALITALARAPLLRNDSAMSKIISKEARVFNSELDAEVDPDRGS